MNDESSEYVFTTHDDVARIVRTMEKDLLNYIPPMVWVGQSEQLAAAVRNHLDEMGCSVADKILVKGMLYGSMLAINLEAQMNEISPATIMLTAVLLDMYENPDAGMSTGFTALRSALEPAPQPSPTVRGSLRGLFKAIFN